MTRAADIHASTSLLLEILIVNYIEVSLSVDIHVLRPRKGRESALATAYSISSVDELWNQHSSLARASQQILLYVRQGTFFVFLSFTLGKAFIIISYCYG